MSDPTKKQFMQDLKTFYTAFTGNTSMPDNITKFSDIKLKNYTDKNTCSSSMNNTKYVVSKNDKLFVSYANNIKNMIQNAFNNQHKLLSVINDIFVYINDPFSNKKVIRINPKLTEESLQKTVEKTRKIIIDLYIKCEMDYVNGIKIYEAIIESKILETTQKQIESLKLQANQLASDISSVKFKQ
jgi:hypothetical protein